MLLYDSPNPAPNPRRVRIFLAEKGVEIPIRSVMLREREHKQEAYLRINPLGQTPTLALDDGRILCESVSICRYLEALYPLPSLFGEDPFESAVVDMWIRRIDLRLGRAISGVWLHTHPLTAALVRPQYKDYGESQRALAVSVMTEFDGLLAPDAWLTGGAYSMADIVLLTTLDFSRFIGLQIPEGLDALNGWFKRAKVRPSAEA
jgi:glutathione S-transferase